MIGLGIGCPCDASRAASAGTVRSGGLPGTVAARGAGPARRLCGCRRGYRSAVFVFFSNRLGCGGSLLLSLVVTLFLLLLMGVIRL